MKNFEVVVLGAGISGLATAVALLEEFSHLKVHIIAKSFPGDEDDPMYTSPRAGANWRGHGGDLIQQGFDAITYRHLYQLAESAESAASKTGLMIIDQYEYWDIQSANFSAPWFKDLCREYRELRPEELPSGVQYGIKYKTVSINPTKYLQYLLNKFTFLGGTLERKTVFHINDCIQDGTQVVINCCGLSASTLGGVRDSKVYPVRGCTILAKFPNVLREGFIRRHHDGAMTYLIPRDDGIGCLGGTFEENNESQTVPEEIYSSIISRVHKTWPSIGVLVDRRYSFGFRPYRHGGVNLKGRKIEVNDEAGSVRSVIIIDHYGHGGGGFESTYGTAQDVMKIVAKIPGINIVAKL